MNTILLRPTDILFFRDGRPMGGASAGHGAAWPLPTVINHAFHAALHRAGDIFQSAHPHCLGRNGIYGDAGRRDRRFGSLATAGPFPVSTANADPTWYFPRPADADDSGSVFLCPHRTDAPSSLAAPCKYPVTSTRPPSKGTPKSWWNLGAWNSYLRTAQVPQPPGRSVFISDGDFADTEHTYGIGINPDTGTVEEGQFYSANYLRLREAWRLGVLAAAPDKKFQHAKHGNDLVRALLNGRGTEIIAGGQQRVCTATLEPARDGGLPLPIGRTDGFHQRNGHWLVKWILLAPAIWPEIPGGISKGGETIHAHPGGWLPNWIFLDWDAEAAKVRINKDNGRVLLKLRMGNRWRDYTGPRVKRVSAGGESDIEACLVAAIVPKPIPVTGWALANDSDRAEGGAKSTHLAVPAGAVYYFEAESEADAKNLAAALNWHGSDTQPTTIRNRRSTLMGEKGFGLGVCGTWDFFPGTTPQ